MIYFTGDTHFGHTGIIRFCERPFSGVDEMNAILTANWNSRVREKDTVYILGDMFYHCETNEVERILRRLKGHKKLLIGNHDSSWMSKIDASKYFDDISLMMEESDGRHEFTLCHYPMLSWRRDSKAYMIHGHIHNDISLDYWPVIAGRDRIINAGVDVNGFIPVTFEEMVANNIQFKKRGISGI
ncbi:MAG: metallophosphoesterase [Clostridiales bacterium]|nr:metallophosphoesterase [Clostridiales bacterium]